MIWMGLTAAIVWALQNTIPNGRAVKVLNANTLFMGGFVSIVLVDQLGLTIFRREIQIDTMVFACLSIVAFGAGAVLAGRQSSEAAPPTDKVRSAFLRFCLLAIPAYCLTVAPSIPLVLASSLSELRAAHWLEFGGDRGPFGVLTALLRAAACVVIILLPNLLNDRRIGASLLGCSAVIALYIETAASGGRFMFLITMLAALLNYLSFRRKISLPIVMIFAVVAYYSLAVFPVARNPMLLTHPYLYFGLVEEVVPADWIINLDASWLREHLIGLAYSSTYITVVPFKLQFFIQGLQVQEWFMLGGYNFRYLSFIPAILNDQAPGFFEAREIIENYSLTAGYGGNPWSTGFRDLLVDFGWIGSVVASGLIGFVLTRLSSFLYEEKSYVHRAIGALSACSGLVFVFLSPFVITSMLNCLLLLLGCLALSKVATSNSRSRAKTTART